MNPCSNVPGLIQIDELPHQNAVNVVLMTYLFDPDMLFQNLQEDCYEVMRFDTPDIQLSLIYADCSYFSQFDMVCGCLVKG